MGKQDSLPEDFGMGSGVSNNRNVFRSLVADINVTPFVDVMLVLLIIFMVTAPMMMQGVDVKLPQVQAPAIESKEERLIITVNGERKIFVNEYEVAFEELVPKLEAIYANRAGKAGVFIRADENLPYGFVMEVMGKIRQAGVEEIGMVTEGGQPQRRSEQKR
ncbi:MAG: protein TolR [Syntrophobacterales bacterium]|nr:protein TolR [Syntrophobacterales bacterium]